MLNLLRLAFLTIGCCQLVAAELPSSQTVKPSLALAPLFTDHMVLQREKPVPVWGTARPGEEIIVRFGQQAKKGLTDGDGRWMVKLDPMPPCSEPRELTVDSAEQPLENGGLKCADVLVGEVWLAGGQSNMGSKMREYLEAVGPEIPRANHPAFRVYTVPQRKVLSDSSSRAVWEAVSPKTVGDISATAYFFGRDLHRHLGIPVGIVVCAWGGTLAENWMDRELLRANPETKPIVERYDATVAAYGGEANYQGELAKHRELLAKWQAERRSEGRAGPRPKEPMGPEHFQRPSGLYATMFKTIPPFAFRGIIFYQGESNVADGRSYQYRFLLPMLVKNWRRDLGQNLPFLAVQLPVIKGLHQDEWAEMRESQWVACRDTEGCELAVVLEFGEFNRLHPLQKEGVGARLALLARGTVYEEKIVCRGPILRSHRIEGSRVILEFDSVGGGLVARDGLRDFTLCGDSGEFVPAQARIVGSAVEVSCDQITKPAAVRYGWKNYFEPSLFNREGLPAMPFRTDQFKLKTEGNR